MLPPQLADYMKGVLLSLLIIHCSEEIVCLLASIILITEVLSVYHMSVITNYLIFL
jgi:hypothetical protein